MAIPANMNRTIYWTSSSLGGLGLFTTFAAHADLAVITSAWAAMFMTLSIQAGHKITKAFAIKIATGILIGVGGLLGGAKLANAYFAFTGFGTIPAMLANASTNATLTYIVGKATARTFIEMSILDSVERIIASIIAIILSGDK